jgi:hypothetical protein
MQEGATHGAAHRGGPDDSFPADAVRSDREPNSDFVRYVGFAD